MKNKKTKTKKTKKVVFKRAASKARGVMAIIPYKDIAKPEVHQGKHSLIPTPFTEKQIVAILSPTPQNVVKTRPGKGGKNFTYVPAWWFKKKLNFVFGFGYDFQIIGERVDGDFITVKGRLVVRDPKSGQTIAIKEDYGGAAIKYLKGTKQYLDLGNDFKAAQSDCMKRCAVQLGFCSDVYGVDEAKMEGFTVEGDPHPIEITIPDVAEEKGLQSELGAIIELLKGFGFSTVEKQLAAVNRLMGWSLKDWKMTKTEARSLQAALLKKKLELRK